MSNELLAFLLGFLLGIPVLAIFISKYRILQSTETNLLLSPVNKKRKNYSYIANIPSAAFVANKNGDIIETNSVFQRLFPNVTDVRFGETDLKGPYKWIHPKDFDNLVDFARAARNLRFGCLETTFRVLQNSDQW
ncbi:MAG: hypothetical protein RJB13_1511, partial [Pseudomonadota bacterium]